VNILILHASAGSGHKRAAEALAKAFALAQPDATLAVRDILDFTTPLFRKSYGTGYLDLVRKAPELWGYMYSQSDRHALEPFRQKVRAAFNDAQARAFRNFCDDFKPDAAVCTHFMPLEMLSRRTGARRKERIPLYGVVTDYGVHALWIVQHVRRYFVATEESRRLLIRKGYSAEQVSVTGIPVDSIFASAEPAAQVRARLGLRQDLPTVLIMSGGFGVGPTVDLLRSFVELKGACQLLVVAGANKRLQQDVAHVASTLECPVKVYGFVNNVHELMDAADLVVSKPGGLTTSEILAKGKPMIVVDPIPGQEQRNCEYLLEAGAAVRLYAPEDAPFKVQSLLDDPRRLQQMRVNAQSIARSQAAAEIVHTILADAGRL